MKISKWFAGLLVVGLMVPAIASAQSIGLQFPSDREASGLAPGEVAGVIPQANWNYAAGGVDALANASGTTATIVSPNAGMLTDSAGGTVSTTVEWTSNGTWNTTNGVTNPEAKLMNGYIDAINAGGFSSVTFRDIPYTSYDAVVYFGSDGNDRTGALTDGTSTFSYNTFSNGPTTANTFTVADYVLTADATGNPRANYAVFSGLSSADWTVDVLRGSSNSGIHGVQIVNTAAVNASIVWDAVDPDTRATDLIGGPVIPFTTATYPGGNADGTFFTGDGGDTGNVDLNKIYNSHGWNGAGATITIDGLNAGTEYQVQLLGAGDTRGCCATRNQAADDGAGNVSGDFQRGNSSVIGHFTATSSTQNINIVSGTANGVDPGLSGYILTDGSGKLVEALSFGFAAGSDGMPTATVTVPEPGSSALLALGSLVLFGLRRRQR